MAEEENKELRKIIREHIRQQGPLTFAQFMDLVLYHPQEGYYQSGREKIGSRGDYYTSPSLHPIFGSLLARQIRQMWSLLDYPSPFTIVEMGAGSGLLCSHILDYCQKYFPEFFSEVRYLLVEKSSFFIEKPEKILTKFLSDGKVELLVPSLFFKESQPIVGCFLSNELIDSFPVHLLRQEKAGTLEIYVDFAGSHFVEVLGPPSSSLLLEYLQKYAPPLSEDQRVEVNLKALTWLAEVNQALKKGFVLTIDYGYEAEELYHPSRKEGTLLCYYRHTTSSHPYEHLGYQDITAHVNFTALIKEGETLGLKKIGLREQYKFLAALGLLRDLENLETNRYQLTPVEFLKHKIAMKSFLVPGGMGTLFKVLIQGKEVEEVNLLGLEDIFLNSARKKR